MALCSAGLPVIIGGAKELISRFEATDYIGVVPHHLPTRYCESLFPDEYGEIINFTHVYKGEDLWFDKIVWLPEEQAFLTAARAPAGMRRVILVDDIYTTGATAEACTRVLKASGVEKVYVFTICVGAGE